MPTRQQNEAIGLYANVLDEIKVRLSCIETSLQGGTPFPGPIIRECCYLQLRIICELIALGCLIAHGDIPAAKVQRIQKEWSAHRIIQTLEGLHPDFYPKPHVQHRVKAPDGSHGFHLADFSGDFLSRDDLIK